ncbi:hypothetical protein [Dietzia psychralcaliphila]|uniref:Uncharacterized protein n=1 Tax=Dietzia psychralcaliphila TaxID=139021 RepID=A0AAD0JPQ5_9ACTN|nr:hypothetical protein [Dietzia psychralcaliphila]AWH94794.1 hypothetical protein A6048_03980 [Dietzia psychralcaliphila]PTM86923.1 hypothetical protein C8N39_106254 [Dietzia psychralcaliphila]
MTSDARRPADDHDPWAPHAAEPAPTRPRRRGLFVAALAVFAVGVVFTILAALTPFVLGRDAPTLLYLGAMVFTPVGFLLGLLYAILGSRPPRV